VTDGAGNTASTSLSLLVNQAPGIISATLFPSEQGIAFSQQFQNYGGTGSLAWSATSLPPGLSLSSTGLLSGTPTASGAFSPVLTVTDANGVSASLPFTGYSVAAPLTLVTTALPDADRNSPYSAHVLTTGGVGPVFVNWTNFVNQVSGPYTVVSDGSINGKFTSFGSFTVPITAGDSLGASATGPISLTINFDLTVNSATGLSASESAPFSLPLTGSGGEPPYRNWMISSGSLPPGLTLAPGTGVISGTATGPVTSYSFQVTVQDALGVTSAATPFTIDVTP